MLTTLKYPFPVVVRHGGRDPLDGVSKAEVFSAFASAELVEVGRRVVFRGDVGGNHAVPVVMDVEMVMSPQVRLRIRFKPSSKWFRYTERGREQSRLSE